MFKSCEDFSKLFLYTNEKNKQKNFQKKVISYKNIEIFVRFTHIAVLRSSNYYLLQSGSDVDFCGWKNLDNTTVLKWLASKGSDAFWIGGPR